MSEPATKSDSIVSVDQLMAENERLRNRLERMVSDVARLEDDIAVMMRRFQADSEAVTLQMANFAHEFRNPLNVIVGYSELLRDTPDLKSSDKRHGDYCNAIHDAAQLLLGVATGVIDSSSAATNLPPVELEKVDASRVIDEMIRMLSEEARKKNISLLANYSPNFPLIDADKLKLQQVLMNLMSNAIKFTKSGGRVTVSTEISDDGENLILVVSDNGVGMTEKETEEAMKPWGRIDSMIDRQAGSGLGLPITMRLIEMMGWKFALSSNKGVGTTARIIIPQKAVVTKSGKKQSVVSDVVMSNAALSKIAKAG